MLQLKPNNMKKRTVLFTPTEDVANFVRSRVTYNVTEHWVEVDDDYPFSQKWHEIEVLKVEVSTVFHPDKGLDITDQLIDWDINRIVSMIRDQYEWNYEIA